MINYMRNLITFDQGNKNAKNVAAQPLRAATTINLLRKTNFFHFWRVAILYSRGAHKCFDGLINVFYLVGVDGVIVMSGLSLHKYYLVLKKQSKMNADDRLLYPESHRHLHY